MLCQRRKNRMLHGEKRQFWGKLYRRKNLPHRLFGVSWLQCAFCSSPCGLAGRAFPRLLDTKKDTTPPFIAFRPISFLCFWPATGMSRSPSSRVRSGSPMRRNQAYEGKKYAGYHLDFNFPSLIVPKHGVTQKDDVKAGEMGNLIGVKTALDFAAKTSKSICTIPEAKNLQHKTPFSPKDYGDESNIDLTTKTIQGG